VAVNVRSRSWRIPTSALVGPLLVLFGALFQATPAGATDLPPLRPETPPYFNADVAVSLDSTGQTALAVTVTVPYSELQWIKVGAGFAAGAEFVVVFEPRDAGRQYGDAWERRLVVPDFDQTNSATRVITERRRFRVKPGQYRVRVVLHDLNASTESVARQQISVRDFSKDPVGFADLEIGVVDSLSGFAQVPTRRFGLNVEHLAARVVLFDRRPGSWPREYPFRYRIEDEVGAEVITGVANVTLSHSAEPVIVRPSRSDLFLGSYVFELEFVDGRSRWIVDRSFEVEESGPPRGKEFQRMLEPLSYIAEPKEIEHLRALPESEQAQGWEAFWRRRDPTPETSTNEYQLEFFRRVRYAEKHFQGFGPGWRSDMGRIYIRHGAPDQTESRPPSATTPQLEIWYYNSPYRRYVFVDREGFGRFVLLSPALE
jgi:GWxTD domain-containing protein